MTVAIITTVIGAVVAFLFGLLNKKLNKMMRESEEHHEEHKKISIAERELLLAVADTTILMAKKLDNADSVNGELEESIKYIRDKKHAVQDMTREIAFEHLEK